MQLINAALINAALVAFIFVCIIFPHLIKHRAQFYIGVALALGTILLNAVTWGYFFYVLIAIVQVATILIFILAAGGLSARDLAGEFTNAYEVIRRGEDKPIVVPIGKQKESPIDRAADEGKVVYEATPEEIRKAQEHASAPATPPAPPSPPADDKPIPLS